MFQLSPLGGCFNRWLCCAVQRVELLHKQRWLWGLQPAGELVQD